MPHPLIRSGVGGAAVPAASAAAAVAVPTEESLLQVELDEARIHHEEESYPEKQCGLRVQPKHHRPARDRVSFAAVVVVVATMTMMTTTMIPAAVPVAGATTATVAVPMAAPDEVVDDGGSLRRAEASAVPPLSLPLLRGGIAGVRWRRWRRWNPAIGRRTYMGGLTGCLHCLHRLRRRRRTPPPPLMRRRQRRMARYLCGEDNIIVLGANLPLGYRILRRNSMRGKKGSFSPLAPEFFSPSRD